MSAKKLQDYMTIQEAAEMLHMGESTLRKKIAAGLISTFKPGRQVLIRVSDIHRYVNRFPHVKEVGR